jgi:hypothetical protein
MQGSYLRFIAMVVTSTIVMYGVMYLNTYEWDHVFFSETRAYMALLMGSVMTVVMLLFMLGMYNNTAANFALIAGAALVFSGALYLVRSQVTVEDQSWMRAMIPHHSIAILTSERANISDPRVRNLAQQIVDSQRQEIAEMKTLLRELAGDARQTQADDASQ